MDHSKEDEDEINFKRSLSDYDILLDTQSPVHVFKNHHLLNNIKKTDKPILLVGVNGAKTLVDETGTIDGIGEVYFSKKVLANILSFAKLSNKDYNKTNDTFTLNVSQTTWTFEPADGHYVFNIITSFSNIRRTKCLTLDSELIDSPEYLKKLYTKKEVRNADEARKLHAALGFPSFSDYITMLKNGVIPDTQVTHNDAERALRIYGKDAAMLAGKGTRKKSPVVSRDDLLTSTSFARDTILAIDGFQIGPLKYLLGYNREIGLTLMRPMQDKSQVSLRAALDSFIDTYRARRFNIKAINSDGDAAVKSLHSHLLNKKVHLNITAADEHVPDVERNGRIVKERVRTVLNSLPYTLPISMLRHLVNFVVFTLNLIPRQGTITHGLLSPREIFTGIKAQMKNVPLKFGEFVLISSLSVKGMDTRRVAALYLGPSGNIQGSMTFVRLDTWGTVTRNNFDVIPIDNVVINNINKRARSEKTPDYSSIIFTMGIEENLRPLADDENLTSPVIVNENTVYPTDDMNQNYNFSSPERSIEDVDKVIDLVHEIDANSRGDRLHDDIGPNADSDAEDSGHYALGYDSSPVYEVGSNQRGAGSPYNLRPNPIKRVFTTIVEQVLIANISVKNALKLHKEKASESIGKELMQMFTKDVYKVVNPKELTKEQRKNVIRSHMFLKFKRDESLKARIVADGRMQDRSIIDEPSSPTVSLESIFATAAIEARERRRVVTVDIEGAFLHAKMEKEMYMELDPTLSQIILELKPEHATNLHNGKLVVKLEKALYGLVESARLFYEDLSRTLLSLGFTKNAYDECVFNRKINDQVCTITVYVDDLKISSNKPEIVDNIINELEKAYKKVNAHEGPSFDYLGMVFNYKEDGSVSVNMEKYILDILSEWEVTKPAPTPASVDLFKVTDSPPLLGDKREKFHSTVQRLLYLSKHVRPDILTAVSFLTTRVTEATFEDMKKLHRVLRYLFGTAKLELNLSIPDQDGYIKVSTFIDAAYALHDDCKGHTGVAVTLGNGVLFSKSTKQKLVARSSTEAELIGIHDGIVHGIWMKNFLTELGYEVNCVDLLQDNKSTIILAEKGKSKSNRTKHIAVRYFYIKDLVNGGEVKISYMPTEDMIAEFFTKPLQGAQFLKLRDLILNTRPSNVI